MPNETRINLKHLLEDIRDSYSSPIEEVIITELIANALDSGASRVDFAVNFGGKFLACVDNGRGMTRAQFREYHNIASSEKKRGQGIGFAGVGAKLSLLLADKVITETKGPRAGRCASEWRLSSSHRAPWKNIPSAGVIPYSRGTSVSIFFTADSEKLLNETFIQNAIIKHFYPLLNPQMMEKILRHIYKKDVEFSVNGKKVSLPEASGRFDGEWFEARLKKQRRPIGCGFVAERKAGASWLEKITGGKPMPLSLNSGLTVSTYGKIIKSGWEWIGLSPGSAYQLVGVVEMPALAELLTTNKDNFLSDSASLKKYYRLRKSIQEAVAPILKLFGENQAKDQGQTKEEYIKPLRRQIEGALGKLADEFPELNGVIGIRRAGINAVKAADKSGLRREIERNGLQGVKLGAGNNADELKEKNKDKRINTKPDSDGSLKKNVSRPGLKIVLEPFSSASESGLLGRIMEDTVYINTKHPAWAQAVEQKWEEYHIAVAVALILYDFVAGESSPQEFVSKFLRELSEQKKPRTLF